MLKEKVREYTILLVILLLLILASDVRGNYSMFCSVCIAGIITYWITRNPIYSLYSGVAVLFLFYLLSNTSLIKVFERFESAHQLDGALEDVETRLKITNEPEPEDDAETALMNVLNNTTNTQEISVPKVGDPSMKKYATSIQTRDLATAQKDTFAMINSVKQLQDVITSLGPTLKSGAKVMQLMKSLNLS